MFSTYWMRSRAIDRSWLGRSAVAVLGIAVCLSATGCLSSLDKHAIALSTATAPVVKGAAIAYHNAQSLHDTRVDYDAVAEFDRTAPVYNPRKIEPLLSEKGIETRLAVLAAFQCYTRYVAEIASGTDSKALRQASASMGSQLATLGNQVAPAVEATLGIAQASAASTTTTDDTATTATATPLTPAIQNGVSTAVDALARFLVAKKIKRELPKAVAEMDKHVQLLAKLLDDDIDTIQDQETRDYNFILNRQTLFIRTATTLDPQQRRLEIMKLPDTVRQQRVSSEQLALLKAAIANLALVHRALAAAAQGNNPESFKAKLQELAGVGGDLGHFYSSLPSQ